MRGNKGEVKKEQAMKKQCEAADQKPSLRNLNT